MVGYGCSSGSCKRVAFAILLGRQDFWLVGKTPEGNLSIVSCVGVAAILMFMLRRRLENHLRNQDTFPRKIFLYLCLIVLYLDGLLYLLARVYLLFIVFRNFASSPEGIYVTPPSWARYLSHVGA